MPEPVSPTSALPTSSGQPAVGLERDRVLAALDACLTPTSFKDYGPNGLQVQGSAHVAHVVTGVTASLALIEAAIAVQADALLVHHGLFWRGQDGRVTGWMQRRLKALLLNDINLYAYHLPLDAHPTMGNNAQLARVLGLRPTEATAVALGGVQPVHGALAGGEVGGGQAAFGRFGEQNLGFLGCSPCATLGELAATVAQRLGRAVTCVGDPGMLLGIVAWCTGGAQSYFEPAVAAGANAFLTGEISEPQAHLAREMGVGYLACGHHATERYGVQAVGDHLARTLGVKHTFIDIDNPA